MPPFLTIQSRHNPLEKATKILSDPLSTSESMKDDIITSILHNCDFFTKYFSSPLKLEEFIQLAKHQIEYEVHEFGQVLVKEKDSCDKFHILLRGTVQKFHQKGQMELEEEVHEERRRSSFRASVAFGRPVKDFTREFTSEIKTPTDRRKSSLKKALITGVNRISLLGRIFPKGNSESPMRKRGLSVNTENTLDSQPDDTNSPLSAVSTFSRRPRKSKVYYPVQQETSRSASPNVNYRHNFSRFSKVQFGLGDDIFITEDTTTQLDTEEFSQSDESPLSADHAENEKNCVIKFATVKNPELLPTCFLDNVVKVKNIRTYGPGDYFTENFYKTSQPKENSMMVVSSEEAHFLTITRDNFIEILVELEERANQKHKFFHDLFPMFEGQEARFSQLFGQQIYSKDELIYSQNDKNDQCVYLLYSGEVKLMTDLSINKLLPNLRPKGKLSIEEVPVTSVVKGQFFGEESLIKKANRECTAIANSANTIVYYLKPEILKKFSKEYEHFFTVLRGNARRKFAWRKEKADELLVNQLSPNNKTRPSIIYTPKASTKKPESGGNGNKRKLLMSFGSAEIGSGQLTSMKSEGNITFDKSDSYKYRFSRFPNNGRLNTESDHFSDKAQRSDSPPIKLDPFSWNFKKELVDNKKPLARSGRSAFYAPKKIQERVSLSTEGSCYDLKAFPNIHMMRTAMNLKSEAMARDAENIQIIKSANIHTFASMGGSGAKNGGGKKGTSSISVRIFTSAK